MIVYTLLLGDLHCLTMCHVCKAHPMARQLSLAMTINLTAMITTTANVCMAVHWLHCDLLQLAGIQPRESFPLLPVKYFSYGT